MPSARRPAGSAPSAARLHDAALAHLSRYAATRAGLLRVLVRRIDRWARAAVEDGAEPHVVAADAARAHAAAAEVVARLAQSGTVDDAAFAGSRARSLARTGHSRRAVAAHLAARGVPTEIARALPDAPEAELAAAIAHAKRRRLGPFAPPAAQDTVEDPARRRRALAGFARAGFSQDIATRALRLDLDTAEQLLRRLRNA